MISPPLKDNADLFRYLIGLSKKLCDARHFELADTAKTASLFASGSPSEFLHEAQSSLEQISMARPEQIDLGELDSVIAQIKEAFKKIGGA